MELYNRGYNIVFVDGLGDITTTIALLASQAGRVHFSTQADFLEGLGELRLTSKPQLLERLSEMNFRGRSIVFAKGKHSVLFALSARITLLGSVLNYQLAALKMRLLGGDWAIIGTDKSDETKTSCALLADYYRQLTGEKLARPKVALVEDYARHWRRHFHVGFVLTHAGHYCQVPFLEEVDKTTLVARL